MTSPKAANTILHIKLPPDLAKELQLIQDACAKEFGHIPRSQVIRKVLHAGIQAMKRSR